MRLAYQTRSGISDEVGAVARYCNAPIYVERAESPSEALKQLFSYGLPNRGVERTRTALSQVGKTGDGAGGRPRKVYSSHRQER